MVALGGLNSDVPEPIEGDEPEVAGEVIHIDDDQAFTAYRSDDDSASDYSDVEEREAHE